MHDKSALTTGASTGLGALLPERLAREGWRHVLLNCRAASSGAVLGRLKALAPPRQVEVVPAGLADRDAVTAAAWAIAARHPRIDVLFNNAAVLLGELRYSKHDAAQSKLALTTLTNAPALEVQRAGIILCSVDPGGKRTKMTAGSGMPRFMRPIERMLFKLPEHGTRLIYDAALSADLGDQSSIYLENGKIKALPQDARDQAVQAAVVTPCPELTQL